MKHVKIYEDNSDNDLKLFIEERFFKNSEAFYSVQIDFDAGHDKLDMMTITLDYIDPNEMKVINDMLNFLKNDFPESQDWVISDHNLGQTSKTGKVSLKTNFNFPLSKNFIYDCKAYRSYKSSKRFGL